MIRVRRNREELKKYEPANALAPGQGRALRDLCGQRIQKLQNDRNAEKSGLAATFAAATGQTRSKRLTGMAAASALLESACDTRRGPMSVAMGYVRLRSATTTDLKEDVRKVFVHCAAAKPAPISTDDSWCFIRAMIRSPSRCTYCLPAYALLQTVSRESRSSWTTPTSNVDHVTEDMSLRWDHKGFEMLQSTVTESKSQHRTGSPARKCKGRGHRSAPEGILSGRCS
eukprot:GHVU01032643.1.p1 GENE.GHVU01032643.1~~GHVU01032643.1.p1  ORF type:complete len:228 (-),score=14.43 GHVU01032643.1:92-775(-)